MIIRTHLLVSLLSGTNVKPYIGGGITILMIKQPPQPTLEKDEREKR